jgi:hypothetical protein
MNRFKELIKNILESSDKSLDSSKELFYYIQNIESKEHYNFINKKKIIKILLKSIFIAPNLKTMVFLLLQLFIFIKKIKMKNIFQYYIIMEQNPELSSFINKTTYDSFNNKNTADQIYYNLQLIYCFV